MLSSLRCACSWRARVSPMVVAARLQSAKRGWLQRRGLGGWSGERSHRGPKVSESTSGVQGPPPPPPWAVPWLVGTCEGRQSVNIADVRQPLLPVPSLLVASGARTPLRLWLAPAAGSGVLTRCAPGGNLRCGRAFWTPLPQASSCPLLGLDLRPGLEDTEECLGLLTAGLFWAWVWGSPHPRR